MSVYKDGKRGEGKKNALRNTFKRGARGANDAFHKFPRSGPTRYGGWGGLQKVARGGQKGASPLSKESAACWETVNSAGRTNIRRGHATSSCGDEVRR